MYLFRKLTGIASLLLFISVVIFGQNDSVVNESRWHRNKVTVASMDKRIADAAEELEKYAPIPRTAFYDIGYPQSNIEFNELDGFGVILISSISQTKSELPLKRVYSVIEGKEIELVLVTESFTEESDSKSRVFKTFGAFRVDSLYLFPVYLRKINTNLFIDFAENRTGMKITNFTGELPEFLKNLPDVKPAGNPALSDSMKRFIKREFPGFSDN